MLINLTIIVRLKP